MIKSICIISNTYPCKGEQESVFVARIVEEFANQSVICKVIAPQSIATQVIHHKVTRPIRWTYKTNKGFEIEVIQPKYYSFGNLRIGKYDISSLMFNRAVYSALTQLQDKPDAIYGHFWSKAYAGYSYAKKNNIPLFVASGESKISLDFIKSDKIKYNFSQFMSGVIAVSSKNKVESRRLGLLKDGGSCVVLPNGVDSKKFTKIDKTECRAKLSISQDKFILIFVGQFIDRKGVTRLSQAVDMLNDKDIEVIFIGKGEQKPSCKGVIFQNTVVHPELVTYYNSADVFVLPTQHEGCCNAIVEALACGLPIISSDREFNHDILNVSNSILIDPDNVSEIAQAIKKVKDDSVLRQKLSNGSIEMSKKLDIKHRATNILEYMSSQVKNR